jgi:hypothetical protein
MKVVTLLVALAIVPSGQTGTTSVAGSWTAQFEGTTFVRLELKIAGIPRLAADLTDQTVGSANLAE